MTEMPPSRCAHSCMLRSGGATLETHMVRKDLFKTIGGLPLYLSPGHCAPNSDQDTLGAEDTMKKKVAEIWPEMLAKKNHFVQEQRCPKNI